MDNNYKDFKKSQSIHTRCVVCGNTFASTYDEELKSFPIFHPNTNPRKTGNCCETKFYESLMHVYAYLFRLENSVTSESLVKRFNWRGKIMLKKETLAWWLARGYLALDELRRIIIPPPVKDITKEIFTTINLENQSEMERAIEMLMAAFRCLKDELEPLASTEMPFKQDDLQLGDSRLFDNIDTKQVSLRRDKPGMVTRNRTGAQDIDKRVSCATNSMERRRMNRKS